MPSRFGLPNLKRGQTKAQKPADMDTQEWADRLQRAARNLVARVIPPGERYLIRWSGTRKGSGTFYTRPALTEPLIRETLRPLCFEADGTPKKPEAILSLRVLDPAMGSASFLVGALRYLTHALYDSLIHHRFREDRPDRVILTLPFGLRAVGSPGESLPPVHPDDADAEPKLKRRLKRFVVERCIYGVDINPLAVELAKLAVWVETLDPDLPFGFLDHKLRCGNGLVGCWLDRVDDYPILAWDREGGDGKAGVESKALKEAFKAAKKVLEGQLFSGASWVMAPDHKAPEEVLPAARKALGELHEIPIHDVDQQREAWTVLAADPALHDLQQALDRWCALFFWPGVDDAGQPLKAEALPMPDTWRNPAYATTVQRLASCHRFFHWELAFPDVFTGPESGFDVVLGNPPWEVSKPNSNEFFTAFDPIFRTYKKNKANEATARLFGFHSGLEQHWNRYVAGFKAMRTWVDAAGAPFAASLGRGKAQNLLAEKWATRRLAKASQSDPAHPFRLQGSGDLNTFKLFTEQARALLRRRGRLGFLVPSGLYTDAGCRSLRETFLTKDAWELLYGFENRREIFKIHRSFKFVITVVTKGAPDPDKPLKAAFMRLDTAELANPDAHTLCVTAAQVHRFAPGSLSFIELRSAKETTLADKLYGSHPLLGDLGGFGTSREFHMVEDATMWKEGTRRKLEASGLLDLGEDTRDPRVRFKLWQAGFVSLVEGKHFWQYNPYYLGNESENGLNKFLDGQKFITRETLRQVAEDRWQKAKEKAERNQEPFHQTMLDFMPWVRSRLVYREIARSTDRRTFISGIITAPHGHKAFDISSPLDPFILGAFANSYCIDWVMRRRVSASLSRFFIETLPIPQSSVQLKQALAVRAKKLMGTDGSPESNPASRLSLRVELDALVASAYSLDEDEFAHILLDTECGAVGFGKTDADLPSTHRQPQLTLDAYRQLLDKGLNHFIQDGVEIPQAALAHRRLLIEVWSPVDGWDTAWAEAEAMANSDHEWDLFLGKEHALQAEYGNLEGALDMAASPEHGKDTYRAEPQHGALFDAEEFRGDGQRRLL
jgi:hypothetical protein